MSAPVVLRVPGTPVTVEKFVTISGRQHVFMVTDLRRRSALDPVAESFRVCSRMIANAVHEARAAS